MVDDMLFFKSVDLLQILQILDKERSYLYTAHLKLQPGINYSHTTDKIISQLPRFKRYQNDYFVFDRTQSELDWNYPFDFCGSVYLLERVVKVIESIDDQQKIRKPNTFEYVGNLAIKKHKLATNYCLCLNLPVMTVITVNKVQDVYDTPVYEFKSAQDEESDCLEIMNQYMRDKKELDIEYYQQQMFNSVHIGDFKIKSSEN